MSIFFWRNNKKHDEFAAALAREFIEKFPNDAEHSIPNNKNKMKLDKVISSIHLKAKEYSENVKLGIYSQARIGNTFMWALKDQEYNEEFIDDITKELLKTLSMKVKSSG